LVDNSKLSDIVGYKIGLNPAPIHNKFGGNANGHQSTAPATRPLLDERNLWPGDNDVRESPLGAMKRRPRVQFPAVIL
jgi:hypothetical protein